MDRRAFLKGLAGTAMLLLAAPMAVLAGPKKPDLPPQLADGGVVPIKQGPLRLGEVPPEFLVAHDAAHTLSHSEKEYLSTFSITFFLTDERIHKRIYRGPGIKRVDRTARRYVWGGVTKI